MRVRSWVPLALGVLFVLPFGGTARAQTSTPRPISATSYIVVDAATGEVVAQREPDRALPVASLQKMLTALVVLEHAHLEDAVTISFDAAHAQADHIIWPERKTFTVDQLLNGMLIESSNGAAIALAEHVAGSQAAFAQLMDEKAAELGATDSHFVNPDGLDAPGQHSTAHDLALIAQTVLADDFLANVVGRRTHDIAWPDGTTTRLHTIDRFLLRYPGAIGIKTGFTSIAGNCLAAAAIRNGRIVIAVVIHSTTVTEDASQLLDAAFGKLGPESPDRPVSGRIVRPAAAARDRVATEQASGPSTSVGSRSTRPGRTPSLPGLAIVFLTSGYVGVRRMRERKTRRA